MAPSCDTDKDESCGSQGMAVDAPGKGGSSAADFDLSDPEEHFEPPLPDGPRQVVPNKKYQQRFPGGLKQMDEYVAEEFQWHE